MSDYNIIWEGEAHPELEDNLRADLAILWDEDEDPAKAVRGLLYHHHSVSGDWDGPAVFCRWDEEADALCARYSMPTEGGDQDQGIQVPIDELRGEDGKLPDWLQEMVDAQEE